MKNNTFIIAEAGVNHNGSLELAYALVDAAVEARADAVKFQTFKTENLVTKSAEQASYQVKNIGFKSSQYEMLKRLELSYEDFTQLNAYCIKQQIEFLATPFDMESVDFLVEELRMNSVKISSGDLTNVPLLHYIATKKKPMILSTGMADISDIHHALSFIAFGLAFPLKSVNVKEVRKFYQTTDAQSLIERFVTILHCTTQYPTPYSDVNLRALDHLRKEFNLQVGLSDHTKGIHTSIAAVAREACVIEKHFTISRKLPGPDHLASLEPTELAELVKAVRIVEETLGNSEKKPTKNEKKNRLAARKSIVATQSIRKGEIFSNENLAVKRPGNGMAPSTYWSLLGKPASVNYEKDELINE